ncbi:SpoIIIAH-like family protein [Crassaminicella profunda]|uniref:SpoIIIAH-like family protein n=1 Tax=Crassaminicella profunda TaxID=1286698 RepID=UPI001CA6A1E7|nr:SpoIIIAH-like family protein [Crassaminicella profunda]QZY56963.1 SpoIIIAH-like family protein [Crassaminicella profunda]
MFRIKRRNVFVFSLVLVLCFIGYLNYAVNKYASLETSSDFEKYEENKLAQNFISSENANDSLSEETNSNEFIKINEEGKSVSVVDSKGNQIEDMVTETSKNIKDTINNNRNVKKTKYFIESRLNMNLERERMISLLNEMINNDRTDATNRKTASDEKMKLIDIMSKEKIVENLIKAKGFEDALVFITDYSINIIVEAEKLNDSDVAKILDIVIRETNFSADNIKISNKF